VNFSQLSTITRSILGPALVLLLGSAGCGSSPQGGSSFDSGLGDHSLHDGASDGTSGQHDTGRLINDGNPDVEQEACATTSAVANATPVDLYMILDRSGSMADNDSWDEEIQALESFVYDPESTGIGIGLQYMPLPDLCNPAAYAMPAVPMGVLTGNAAQVLTSLANSRPYGGTPLVPALEGAVQYAKARQQSNPERTVVIVLSSDGLPDTSCAYAGDAGLPNTEQNAIQVLSAAAAATPPIRTFVIGIGAQTALNTFAMAGGTGKAILVGAADGGVTDIEAPLIAALGNIRTQALPCEYTIPQAEAGTIDPAEVNVTFTPDGQATQDFYGVANAAACQTNNFDWYYDNPASPAHVELCPNTCTQVKAATKAKLQIAYGCTTWTPPIK
jgi:hypothetical protein